MTQNLKEDQRFTVDTYLTKANDFNFSIYEHGASLDGIMDLCTFYETGTLPLSQDELKDAFFKVKMFIRSTRNDLEKTATDLNAFMFRPELLKLLGAGKTSSLVNDEK